MGELLHMSDYRKPRLVDSITAIESLDSFGLPAEPGIIGVDMAVGPDLTVYWRVGDSGENNRRPDWTLIVSTEVLDTGDKEPA